MSNVVIEERKLTIFMAKKIFFTDFQNSIWIKGVRYLSSYIVSITSEGWGRGETCGSTDVDAGSDIGNGPWGSCWFEPP